MGENVQNPGQSSANISNMDIGNVWISPFQARVQSSWANNCVQA